jgi:hypothetical protein
MDFNVFDADPTDGRPPLNCNACHFHGHQINTVEDAVAFYATNRYLRNGGFLPAIVPLNGVQVINVARFMRVMFLFACRTKLRFCAI